MDNVRHPEAEKACLLAPSRQDTRVGMFGKSGLKSDINVLLSVKKEKKSRQGE